MIGNYVKQEGEHDGRPWYQHESNSECRAFYVEGTERWYLGDSGNFNQAIYETCDKTEDMTMPLESDKWEGRAGHSGQPSFNVGLITGGGTNNDDQVALLSAAAPVNYSTENDFTIDLTVSWPVLKGTTEEEIPFAPLLQLHTASDDDSAVLAFARRVGETLELKFGEEDGGKKNRVTVVVRAAFQRISVVRQGMTIVWRVNTKQVGRMSILLRILHVECFLGCLLPAHWPNALF